MLTMNDVNGAVGCILAANEEATMYVIAGATGHTGRVVANTLLAEKQPVRVIVRDSAQGAEWKQRGAEVAVAALDDAAAVAQALRGADAAYLLVPPNYGAGS